VTARFLSNLDCTVNRAAAVRGSVHQCSHTDCGRQQDTYRQYPETPPMGMPEETLFEFERDMTTADVAQYLRTVADHLDSGDEFTLEAGEESVTLTPPGRVEFEVEVERETSNSGTSAEIELEFELEWDENSTDTGELSIE